MLAAIKARKNWKNGNTEVYFSDGTSKCHVCLHGHCIYRKSDEGWAWFTLAGWNTMTTRSRLRALGLDIRTKNFTPIYKGREIGCNETINIK